MSSRILFSRQWTWAQRLFALSVIWLVLAAGITHWDWQDRWHTIGHERSHWIKLYFYWAQYTALPLLIACVLRGRGQWLSFSGLIQGLVVFGLALTVWAGQIEPHMLFERHSTIQIKTGNTADRPQPLRVALVSDIHLGLFVRDWQLRRLVNRLNRIDVDVILVAGDWTYEPKLDLLESFEPLKGIYQPIYGVIGNHDLQMPGPKLTKDLTAALTASNVILIEGKTVNVNGWQLTGLDDLWGGKPAAQVQRFVTTNKQIILTHQPDTAALLPRGSSALTLAGHSHGGQVNVPIATELVLSATMQQPWVDGLYQTPYGQVFTTTGTGMIGLPFRFNMPPRIDVLTIEALP